MDDVDINQAQNEYFKAALEFNALIKAKEVVSPIVVRRCAYWMMMFLYSYQQPSNLLPGGKVRVAVPIAMTNDIARNIQMILTGHIPQWMLALQKTGAPKADPRMARDIGFAVAYKKLCQKGLIADKGSTKTIAELYGVQRRTVQGWMKEHSFVEPKLFFPAAKDEMERANLIAAEIQRAGPFYREWGRGASNARPFGKAERRTRAKR